MALELLRTHALRSVAGLSLAAALSLGGSVAIAPFASASTPVLTTTAPVVAPVATAAAAPAAPAPLTAAQKAAAKKKADKAAAKKKAAKAKAKAKAKKLAAKKKKAAKKKAAKKRAAKKRALVAKRGNKVIAQAARHRGVPYVYGAVGPNSFDCSGYTQYVVRKALGVNLPRTAAQQAYSGKVKRVSRNDRRVGDLVFFPMGGSIGHVGIYAGSGMMWAAPKPGDRVKKQNIWTGNVFYGRVR